jgi:hypothetical protein
MGGDSSMTLTYSRPPRPRLFLRYDRRSRAFVDPLGNIVRDPKLRKVLTILRDDLLDPIDPPRGWEEAWLVRPIKGYNKSTYTVIWRRSWPDDDECDCDCQGFQANKSRARDRARLTGRHETPEDCAHIRAFKFHTMRKVVVER